MVWCERMAWKRGIGWVIFLASLLVGCATEPVVEAETPKPVRAATGAPISFAYPTLDGQVLSTSSIAGRYTVLSFITTYDHFSHAQARFLSTVMNKHVPRINAGVIVLEPPQNRILVEAFVKVVAPPYPVAMADEATIHGEGPFLDLHEVPSTIILDQLGREVWRHKGLASNDLIDSALNAVRAGKTPG
jgi:hypothetical protein